MTNQEFEIKILRQHWIKDDGVDDKADLCSHGVLFIKIGDEILSNLESDSWALTATGLYLLRTLKIDYTIDDFGSQLVPCCGHFMIPDEKKNYISILGCNEGVDWNIKHENGYVKLTTEKGTVAIISFELYKNIVLDFTDRVESFYGDPNEKEVPNEEFDQNGFRQFWAEWTELKTEWRKPAHNTVYNT
ncbi:hypothetical protein QSV08_02660 [Maribacter sp. BPC-D8]|uniref:hypothetical protein n=1 Tax=Maribacter sp. BPC-D8 TaxID=3053613 RepID=UPI002B485B3C|nr:hypothetical protein [Maribacter sp. BPC-D8]WRI30144.1 hypothetical protein QSV08_02660 [Maribacter sp. BPC-D8]